jgi:cytochrome c-type biogenesis protein CcmH
VRRTILIVATVLWLGAVPAALAATGSRASLTDIENDVMCVSCREPLAVAESPQAYAERNFIRTLIGRGETKAEIEQALVAQYGPAVLGRPPAHGFNLTIYVLPPALVLLGIALLAVTLPRWRRRARAGATVEPSPRLSPADARRLNDDLGRHP